MSIFRDGEELSVFKSPEAAVDMLCRVMELPGRIIAFLSLHPIPQGVIQSLRNLGI